MKQDHRLKTLVKIFLDVWTVLFCFVLFEMEQAIFSITGEWTMVSVREVSC